MDTAALESETVGDVTVLRLMCPQLTEDAVASLRPALAGLLTPPGRKVVLDFSTVAFAGSAALGLVIQMALKLASIGGGLALCGLKESMRRVFASPPRLSSACPLFETREDAVRYLGGVA